MIHSFQPLGYSCDPTCLEMAKVITMIHSTIASKDIATLWISTMDSDSNLAAATVTLRY